MTKAQKSLYRGHRFPAEVIAHAVWLYFRFPLSLRMVEDLLAARGIIVSHETVRRWAQKFGRDFANKIRRRAPRLGDKWHLDEVVISINGKKHWLWRAVDQDGFVLDALVQSRRDRHAAERLLRKLIRKQARTPRVIITDKLGLPLCAATDTSASDAVVLASLFATSWHKPITGCRRDQAFKEKVQGLPDRLLSYRHRRSPDGTG